MAYQDKYIARPTAKKQTISSQKQFSYEASTRSVQSEVLHEILGDIALCITPYDVKHSTPLYNRYNSYLQVATLHDESLIDDTESSKQHSIKDLLIRARSIHLNYKIRLFEVLDDACIDINYHNLKRKGEILPTNKALRGQKAHSNVHHIDKRILLGFSFKPLLISLPIHFHALLHALTDDSELDNTLMDTIITSEEPHFRGKLLSKIKSLLEKNNKQYVQKLFEPTKQMRPFQRLKYNKHKQHNEYTSYLKHIQPKFPTQRDHYALEESKRFYASFEYYQKNIIAGHHHSNTMHLLELGMYVEKHLEQTIEIFSELQHHFSEEEHNILIELCSILSFPFEDKFDQYVSGFQISNSSKQSKAFKHTPTLKILGLEHLISGIDACISRIKPLPKRSILLSVLYQPLSLLADELSRYGNIYPEYQKEKETTT